MTEFIVFDVHVRRRLFGDDVGGHITIPKFIDAKRVTSIGTYALYEYIPSPSLSNAPSSNEYRDVCI